MKKKIMTLALSAVMAVSLAACGAGGNSDSSSSGSTSASGSSAVSDVSSASAASDASTASSGEEKPETITVKSLNANREEVDLEVPYDPERIAILDMACLDIIDSLGVGDRVVAIRKHFPGLSAGLCYRPEHRKSWNDQRGRYGSGNGV